jgi:hypothetical protein
MFSPVYTVFYHVQPCRSHSDGAPAPHRTKVDHVRFEVSFIVSSRTRFFAEGYGRF